MQTKIPACVTSLCFTKEAENKILQKLDNCYSRDMNRKLTRKCLILPQISGISETN